MCIWSLLNPRAFYCPEQFNLSTFTSSAQWAAWGRQKTWVARIFPQRTLDQIEWQANDVTDAATDKESQVDQDNTNSLCKTMKLEKWCAKQTKASSACVLSIFAEEASAAERSRCCEADAAERSRCCRAKPVLQSQSNEFTIVRYLIEIYWFVCIERTRKNLDLLMYRSIPFPSTPPPPSSLLILVHSLMLLL
jgi:hypothetical protein